MPHLAPRRSSQSKEKQLLLKSALVCLSKWVMTYPFVLNEMLPSSGAGAEASGPSMSSMVRGGFTG